VVIDAKRKNIWDNFTFYNYMHGVYF